MAERAQQTQILIVDDDEGMRTTLADILQENGYGTRPFRCGREAITSMQQRSFDVVLADIKLPDMSGIELLETAKACNPDAAVVMMTGYASIESAVEAMNAGAFAYVTKPFNVDALKATVKKAIRQHELFLENKRLIDDLQLSNRQLAKEIEERKRAEEALIHKTQELERVAQTLRERTDSLERFQRLTVDRELQMVKLKEEINALLEASGQPKKYSAPEQIRRVGDQETGAQTAIGGQPKGRILIVDDEVQFAEAVKAFLEPRGFCVETATDRAQAIAKWRERPFDLTFMDMKIQGSSGLEIFRAIKQIKADAKVVILSGEPETLADLQPQAIAEGMVERFLRKPVSVTEVVHIANELIQHP